jgi:hypothetical protein
MKPLALLMGMAALLAATRPALLAQGAMEGQERAIAALKRLEGKVEVDAQLPGRPVVAVDL